MDNCTNAGNVKDVVIIGGGFAGLSVAKELGGENLDVVLVEASNSLGGRVKQCKLPNGLGLVDLGAEYVHGKNTFAYQAAEHNGWGLQKYIDEPEVDQNYIEAEEVNNRLYFLKGKLVSFNDLKKMKDFNLALELQGLVLCTGTKMRLNRENNSGSEVDENVQDWILKNYKVDESVLNIVDAELCQSEGEDIDKFGLLDGSDNDDRTDCGDGHFRLTGTYKLFLDQYSNETIDIDRRLNWRVSKIDWTNRDTIQVHRDNGDVLETKKVVITVSLAVLKSGCITFLPELPSWKVKAVETFQMRAAVKLVCLFKTRLWPVSNWIIFSDTGLFRQYCTYDVVNSTTTLHAISALATATRAQEMGNLSPMELKDAFLKQLDTTFGSSTTSNPASSAFVDYVLYDWSKDINILGGYSCPSVNSFGCSDLLSLPIENRLFFAGEATNTTGRATVQAAIQSGIRAAEEILHCL